MRIVANIFSLVQHKKTLKAESEQYRPSYCPYCGKAGLWPHGTYPRKADRQSGADESLNPILIPRFFCPGCQKTCSTLPECIPPNRWYLWEIQQAALLAVLMGTSFYAVAKTALPSRQTLKRWYTRFTEQFHLHKDVLCNLLSDLGCAIDVAHFWQTFLKNNLLSTGMRLCHAAFVAIP
jgi:transposase-like protein